MGKWSIVLLTVVAVAPRAGLSHQESAGGPRGSTRVVVTGCLKQRVLTATDVSEPDVVSGPQVRGRTFRLSGARDVQETIKRQNGHLVEVIGLVKTSALAENPPGRRIGRTRVAIGGGPMSTDPTRNPQRDPVGNVIVLDVTSVRFLSEACPKHKN